MIVDPDGLSRLAGSDGEVLRPEESPRCARVLASPPLSIPEHLWPAPDEFGNAGDRQNSFAECGVTIFDSIRWCGPDIPAGWIRSAARRTGFAMAIVARKSFPPSSGLSSWLPSRGERCADYCAKRATIARARPTRAGRRAGGASAAARSFGKPRVGDEARGSPPAGRYGFENWR
jgi:hypothetical protein